MQHGSSNQSAEILARTSKFVPTALQGENDWLRTAEVDWQTAMKRAIRSAADLRSMLRLPASDNPRSTGGEDQFPTFVPLEFLRRIRPGDPNDPLLRQVLPTASEDEAVDGFTSDPVGDLPAVAAGGLLHKYQGRALLISTGACGVHCRYCFRREFPYSSTSAANKNQWQAAIDYLRMHRDIDEVLLSGGDPLTLVDSRLDQLFTNMESIAHLRRLRLHTRMPIVIPQRVTPELVDRFRASRLTVWMVVHANHPRELSDDVLERLALLVDAGIPVLNQAVLLRGVNDQATTLIELCRKLVDHRIQPYYLHQLDRVRGAAHFEVPVETGRQLMRQLRDSLPGYAVPTYVAEEPGKGSKTPIPLIP